MVSKPKKTTPKKKSASVKKILPIEIDHAFDFLGTKKTIKIKQDLNGIKVYVPSSECEAHTTVFKNKEFDMYIDFFFALKCREYAGSGVPTLVVYLLLLAMKSVQKDATVAGTDSAEYSKDKSINEHFLSTFRPKNLQEALKTKVFYYERYGFIYPEKEAFFKKYFETGKYPKNVPVYFYIDLSKVTKESLHKSIKSIKFKKPRNWK
jgi:hypothetical protein